MIVSACHNGGASYGIRIGREDRARYFSKRWRSVQIKIPKRPEITRRLTGSFWGEGSEIRGTDFRDWFEELGHVKRGRKKWKRSNPPEFRLTPMDGNRFRLTKI